jgi:hypothetical protein
MGPKKVSDRAYYFCFHHRDGCDGGDMVFSCLDLPVYRLGTPFGLAAYFPPNATIIYATKHQ